MDIVIFGLGPLAHSVWSELARAGPHRVVAFASGTGDSSTSELHGLPVVPFDTLEQRFPPGRVRLLAPVGRGGMDAACAAGFAAGKAKGYGFISHVSPRAIVPSDLALGENCLIQAGSIIQPFTGIGDNCMVMEGALLSHHVRVGDGCHIAARAVLGGGVDIGAGCVVGANATLRNGIRLAPGSRIRAGAVVVADTEAGAVYAGVPARRQPPA